MPTYQIQNLTKHFGPVPALSGLSFTAHAGEFLVVLGPTGAGKSTLLRTIAGLERPDSGTILEDGHDISATPPAARDMAMVFQNFSLYPRLTVYDNLAFPLRPKWRRIEKSEIDRRVKWAADLLGLTPKLKNLPTELSGGQQQRVAIGRAIVREPKLFLFDEPLASLDAKLREQMAVEIHRLQRRLNAENSDNSKNPGKQVGEGRASSGRGVTMLYVTHDQTEAMSLADRIVVLDQGRVLQIGTPDEIYRRPFSPRVAKMLGSPPINIIPAAEIERLASSLRGLNFDRNLESIGIRPEQLRVQLDANGKARVKVLEHLGPISVALLDLFGCELRASLPPGAAIREGDAVDLAVDGDVLQW